MTLLLFAGAICVKAGEFRLSITGEVKTFDPLQVTDDNSEIVGYLTEATLVRIDRVTDEVRPEIFRLNAAYCRRCRAHAARNTSPVGDVFRSVDRLPAVEVVSPNQIVVRYSTTKAGLERLFEELYIAPPHVALSQYSGGLPASAGPFFVAEYRSGAAVTLKRNPYYWKVDAAGRRLPYLDAIHLEIRTNPDIEVTRFLRWEIDMLRKLDPESFNMILKRRPATAQNLVYILRIPPCRHQQKRFGAHRL